MEVQRAGQHLTEEQFADLLAGSVLPSAASHLSDCPKCEAEVERVSAAVESFAQQSRLWAERRASAAPPIALRDPRLVRSRPNRRQAWTAAVALGLALAAGVGVSVHRERMESMAPVQSSPVPSQTLQADNELLGAIDGELRGYATSPASMYGLSAAQRSGPVKTANRKSSE